MAQSLAEAPAGSEARVFLGRPSGPSSQPHVCSHHRCALRNLLQPSGERQLQRVPTPVRAPPSLSGWPSTRAPAPACTQSPLTPGPGALARPPPCSCLVCSLAAGGGHPCGFLRRSVDAPRQGRRSGPAPPSSPCTPGVPTPAGSKLLERLLQATKSESDSCAPMGTGNKRVQLAS